MTQRNVKETFDGFPKGLIEKAIGNSRKLNRESFAEGVNIRIDETGGVTGRRGVTNRATGLPNNNYSVFEFRNADIHALIGSDGSSIRVLDSGGWTSIGNFTSAGTRASGAVMNQKLYLANGIDRIVVVDYISAAWNVRNVGVDAPTGTHAGVSSGGSGTSLPYRFTITFEDDRGFESNHGPVVTVQGKEGGTTNITSIPTGPSTTAKRHIYSSLRNQRQMFLISTINDNVTTTTSTPLDNSNIARDEAFEAPTEHDIPPNGIFSLYQHKNRMYAAGEVGKGSFYRFTNPVGEPEYWDSQFAQNLTSGNDTSDVRNFEVVSLGLMPLKETQTLVLEGDPVTTSAPQVVSQGAGLVHPDGKVGLNGAAYYVANRGIIAHDGIKTLELWRGIKTTSDLAVQADASYGSFQDVRAQIHFKDDSLAGVIKTAAYDYDLKRWLVDEIPLETGQITDTDTTRDFSEDADVSLHENVENGAQTIATGGTTTAITLSGTNSAKLVAGTVIKFDGLGTIFSVISNVAGTLTLNSAAPANGTAVDYIRGTVVDSGVLKMTRSSGSGGGGGGEVFAERFEATGSPGTDETWNLADVIDTGQSLDTNADTADISSPSGWGSEAMKIVWVNSGSARAFKGHNEGANAITTTAFDFYLEVDNFTTSTATEVRLLHGEEAAGADSLFEVFLTEDGGGNTSVNANMRFDGTDNFQTPVNVALGTSVNIQVDWDDTNNTWEWFVNTVSQSSGAITTAGSLGQWRLGVNPLASVGASGTIWFDNFVVTNELTGGVAPTYPVSTNFSAEVIAKTDFTTFTAFATNPLTLVGNSEPANTDIRYGIRFVSGGPIRTFTGTDWQTVGADPIADAMDATAVGNLTPSDMVTTNGFDSGTPYLQPVVYFRTTDVDATAEISGITIEYTQGTGAEIVWASTFLSAVPVAGSTDTPAGTYVWDTNGGHRLEDGTTDNGAAVSKRLETQQVGVEGLSSWLKRVDIQIDSGSTGTLTVTPLLNDVLQTSLAKTVNIKALEDEIYSVGLRHPQAGFDHAVKLEWTSNDFKLNWISMILEPKGRLRA